MRRRTFGTTDLQASELGFGTWALGSDWWGQTDDPQKMIQHALDAGITFFDTGDAYGAGLNEELVGQALSSVPRDQVEIASKFGYVLAEDRAQHSQGARPQDWSPEHMRKALEASLTRLQTDYLDLYQLHNPRIEAIERAELFEELEKLKQSGKIRHYGVALGPAIGWRDEGLKAIDDYGISSMQTVYNLLEQHPGDDLIRAGRERGVGVIARVPTSSGLLEDKFTLETTFTGNDHRRHRKPEWLSEGLRKIEKLRFLQNGCDRSMTAIAMKFISAQPEIATVLPTFTSVAEIGEYVAAVESADLTNNELASIQELYARNFDIEPATVS